MKIDIPNAGLVFQVWERFYHSYLLYQFTKEEMDDFRQEGYLIALEINSLGLSKKERLRYANRRWYAFLKNKGFYKPKGSKFYYKREETYESHKEANHAD